MRLWIRKSWKNCSSLLPPKYKLRTSSKDLHPCTALSEILMGHKRRPGLYRPQARDGGSSHGFCGAWCHRGAREEGRSYDLTIMTYYDQLCLILVHAEISNLRIHHWSFKGTEPLNMNMWVSFLLNVLENVGCKMCCYYHNWYQVAVSRCPWPWNCWQLRKQRPRCKSIIPWLLAGGFQQCWLSSYFQLSSNDGGYFFPWFSMWLCSIFWPIFVAKTTYLYSS